VHGNHVRSEATAWAQVDTHVPQTAPSHHDRHAHGHTGRAHVTEQVLVLHKRAQASFVHKRCLHGWDAKRTHQPTGAHRHKTTANAITSKQVSAAWTCARSSQRHIDRRSLPTNIVNSRKCAEPSTGAHNHRNTHGPGGARQAIERGPQARSETNTEANQQIIFIKQGKRIQAC
jgi:hypothetical protein